MHVLWFRLCRGHEGFSAIEYLIIFGFVSLFLLAVFHAVFVDLQGALQSFANAI